MSSSISVAGESPRFQGCEGGQADSPVSHGQSECDPFQRRNDCSSTRIMMPDLPSSTPTMQPHPPRQAHRSTRLLSRRGVRGPCARCSKCSTNASSSSTLPKPTPWRRSTRPTCRCRAKRRRTSASVSTAFSTRIAGRKRSTMAAQRSSSAMSWTASIRRSLPTE